VGGKEMVAGGRQRGSRGSGNSLRHFNEFTPAIFLLLFVIFDARQQGVFSKPETIVFVSPDFS
jgi:hypothetical protein